MKKTIFSAFCILFCITMCTSVTLGSMPDGSAFFNFSENSPLCDAVFFGESTTAHLAARGVLPKSMVWANDSGTMRLDASTASRTINDPQSGEPIGFLQAIEEHQPRLLVLSFGLNGIMHFSEFPDQYIGNYRKLIEKVQERSPETAVIVQSIYPVADIAYQSNWQFSVTPKEINDRIETLNPKLIALCEELPNVRYIDTASTIRDNLGFLAPAFTTDGIHFTKAAYEKILSHLNQTV